MDFNVRIQDELGSLPGFDNAFESDHVAPHGPSVAEQLRRWSRLGGNMITIGIRAAPKAVTFAVYDSDARAILNVEDIKIPAAFATPDALKYLRSNLLDVLREFSVERAGVRVTEGISQGLSIERVQIEGVIQEAFASSDLAAYYVGQIASISARVGIDRSRFKPLVAGEEAYDVENWGGFSKEAREAVLCAVGAVNA